MMLGLLEFLCLLIWLNLCLRAEMPFLEPGKCKESSEFVKLI